MSSFLRLAWLACLGLLLPSTAMADKCSLCAVGTCTHNTWDCSGLNLTDVQASVSENIPANVTALNFTRNRLQILSTIPSYVQMADFSKNSIASVSPITGYVQLNTLVMSQNRLDNLQERMFVHHTLRVLRLAGNLITRVHSDAFNLPNLTTLDLSANLFTSLPLGVFQHLGRVRSLIIKTSMLQTIPGDLFVPFNGLTSVDLSGATAYGCNVNLSSVCSLLNQNFSTVILSAFNFEDGTDVGHVFQFCNTGTKDQDTAGVIGCSKPSTRQPPVPSASGASKNDTFGSASSSSTVGGGALGGSSSGSDSALSSLPANQSTTAPYGNRTASGSGGRTLPASVSSSLHTTSAWHFNPSNTTDQSATGLLMTSSPVSRLTSGNASTTLLSIPTDPQANAEEGSVSSLAVITGVSLSLCAVLVVVFLAYRRCNSYTPNAPHPSKLSIRERFKSGASSSPHIDAGEPLSTRVMSLFNIGMGPKPGNGKAGRGSIASSQDCVYTDESLQGTVYTATYAEGGIDGGGNVDPTSKTSSLTDPAASTASAAESGIKPSAVNKNIHYLPRVESLVFNPASFDGNFYSDLISGRDQDADSYFSGVHEHRNSVISGVHEHRNSVVSIRAARNDPPRDNVSSFVERALLNSSLPFAELASGHANADPSADPWMSLESTSDGNYSKPKPRRWGSSKSSRPARNPSTVTALSHVSAGSVSCYALPAAPQCDYEFAFSEGCDRPPLKDVRPAEVRTITPGFSDAVEEDFYDGVCGDGPMPIPKSRKQEHGGAEHVGATSSLPTLQTGEDEYSVYSQYQRTVDGELPCANMTEFDQGNGFDVDDYILRPAVSDQRRASKRSIASNVKTMFGRPTLKSE